MKIEKLTEEQISKLPEYRDKWLKIGLSTEKADHALAEKAVDEAYEKAGLKAPKIKIWLMSPMQGIFGAEYLKLLIKKNKIEGVSSDQLRDQLRGQVWDQVREEVASQVRDQVGDQVRDQVSSQVSDQVWDQMSSQVVDQVWDQIGDKVWDQVWEQVVDQIKDQIGVQVEAQVMDQVGVQVRNQVWEQVEAQVMDQVGVQVKDKVWEQVIRAGYGSHDVFWLGFYDFFKQELNLGFCDKLTPLIKLSEHCGWWWPFEGAVILTEKPTSILRDQNNRLHSMDKMALSYPDGWGVYAIHGVRIPEKYILTPADKINPEEVMKEENSEIRMAVIRKCGFAHFKNNLKHKVISASNGNELIEFELEDEKVRGLKVSWLDKHSFKETILPVARTKKEFKEWASQIGVDFIPDDIDDCEQVRKFTVKMRPSESFSIET